MNFDKVKPYLPWIFRAVVLLVIVVLVWALNSARNANAELRRVVEAEKLDKAGFVVALQQTKADMKEMERRLLMENAWLENERQRLQDELGKKPKIEYIEIIKTVPTPVIGDPLFLPCPGTDQKVACLLPPDSTGHVEATALTYETTENNHVLLGTAECWRDTPAPKAMLFSSKIDVKASRVYMEKQKAAGAGPGWGVGARGVIGSLGWGAGPVLAAPPLPFLFNTQVEFNLDATVGTPWISLLSNPDNKLPPITFDIGFGIVLRGR